ncbi:MAG: hypothetical protein ACRDKJ_13875 [Actinomycetota bacterium]
MGAVGRIAALAAVAIASSSLAPAAHAGRAVTTYRPPYAPGPAGGDEYNVVHRDEASGRIAIGRVFPGIPPVIGCVPEPDAGWATFRVGLGAGTKVRSVVLDVDSLLDPYSWVTLSPRTKRVWLGTTKLQGPVGGAERLTLRLHRSTPAREPLMIEFGVQLGDACPQIGAAMATFPGVTVRS